MQVGGSAAISARHGQHISILGYLLLAAGPAALLVRRHFPATAWWVAVAAAVWFAAVEPARGLPYLALIISFVTAVLAGRRWPAIGGLVVSYLGLLRLPGLTGTGHYPSAGVALGGAAWHLTLLSGAEWYRGRRQRAAAPAQGQQEAERRRASEERLHIARDLHDVVAHSLAVINVQANTALHLIDQQPDRARSTLSVINDVSKQALVELRAVLGVLRQDDDELPRSPVPARHGHRRHQRGGAQHHRGHRQRDHRQAPTDPGLAGQHRPGRARGSRRTTVHRRDGHAARRGRPGGRRARPAPVGRELDLRPGAHPLPAGPRARPACR